MIKIAICDDNIEDIELAKIRLNEISRGLQCDFEIYEFMDDEMMVENIIKQGIEVVLLDIDMPNITGMDVANRLNQEKPFINIIFLTNREELVFQTLKYRPLRFIRKNCMQAELGEAMEVAIKKIAAETYVIHFPKENISLSISIKDIVYLESSRHYVEIHMPHKIHRIRGKLSDWEEQLKDFGFIRIQVGYLVNIRYISMLTMKDVVLDNGQKLAVSRSHLEMVQKQYVTGLERFVNGYFV